MAKSPFDLASRPVGPPCKHDAVQFYAFDILVSEGEDLRNLPLSMRKANLTVIPSFAAHYRNHPQMMPIFLINFFCWTVTGWLATFVWACWQ